jgi:hypothetical protein
VPTQRSRRWPRPSDKWRGCANSAVWHQPKPSQWLPAPTSMARCKHGVLQHSRGTLQYCSDILSNRVLFRRPILENLLRSLFQKSAYLAFAFASGDELRADHLPSAKDVSHKSDWEWAIVKFTTEGNNKWTRYGLLMEADGTYGVGYWGNIPNTFNR